MTSDDQTVRTRLALGGCLAIVTLIGVVSAIVFRSCGETVAEIRLDEEPNQARFELEAPRRIGFSTSFGLSNSRWTYREELPRALDYEIEILRNEKRAALLVCNPFDMFVWRTGKRGQTLTSLEGKLENCTATLADPGAYVVRARRIWRDGGRPIQLTDNTLTVQLER